MAPHSRDIGSNGCVAPTSQEGRLVEAPADAITRDRGASAAIFNRYLDGDERRIEFSGRRWWNMAQQPSAHLDGKLLAIALMLRYGRKESR